MKLISKLRNALQDLSLGIRTGGIENATKAGSVYYASTDYKLIRETLDRLALGPDDVFCDIGAGKGRVLAVAARYPVRSIVGIEYEHDLAAQARNNMNALGIKNLDASIFEGAAENYDYSEVSVAYLFNPFENNILGQVLSKIRKDRGTKAFRCAYVELSEDKADIILQQRWLFLDDKYTDSAGHPVAIFRAR